MNGHIRVEDGSFANGGPNILSRTPPQSSDSLWPNLDLQTRNKQILEKIISWGGALGGVNSTLNHGNLQASGIDVIALGPKFSISILGSEAFKSSEEINRVAELTAKDAGSFNMESCGSARFHFVQADQDQARAVLVHHLAKDIAWTSPLERPASTHFRPPSTRGVSP
jgi:hypothetical protein